MEKELRLSWHEADLSQYSVAEVQNPWNDRFSILYVFTDGSFFHEKKKTISLHIL